MKINFSDPSLSLVISPSLPGANLLGRERKRGGGNSGGSLEAEFLRITLIVTDERVDNLGL